MENKIFNKKLLGTLAFILFSASIFNYIIDPFDVFHTKNKFNQYKPNIDKSQRISKIPAFKLSKEKVSAIWIGSSKTGWSSNEEYEKTILNKNIKNMTLNGSSFYEAILMAKNAALIHPEIDTIYFGIDFCMMKKYVEKPDALKSINKTKITKEEILPLLISLDTTQHSIKTFTKNLKKKPKKEKDYGEATQYNKKVFHKFENTINSYYKESYKNFELDNKKFEDLKTFIKWCKEQNIKLIFFTTTMHITERILIDNTGNLDSFYKFKKELAQIQPYYDFAIIDKYTTDKIAPEMQYFRDAVHAYPFIRKKISNKLFGLKEDFGYFVTQNNIESIHQKDKQSFIKYKKKNPEIIKKVSDWSKE